MDNKNQNNENESNLTNKQNVENSKNHSELSNNLNKRERKVSGLNNLERVLLITNIILALSTVIVAWKTWNMASINDTQLNIIKNNTQTELRAYLEISNFYIENLKPNGLLTVRIDFKNIGKSPARKIKYWITFDYLKQQITPTQIITNLSNAIIDNGSLGPGEESTINSSPDTISNKIFSKIISQKLYLYLYGDFTYSDIWNNNHIKEFCVFYDVKRNAFAYANIYNDEY